jgi:hypothetical protein
MLKKSSINWVGKSNRTTYGTGTVSVRYFNLGG